MPPDEKSQKRVEKLFSELEQIARQPLPSGADAPAPAEKESTPPVIEETAEPLESVSAPMSAEIDELITRILELENKLAASEMRAIVAEAKLVAAETEGRKDLLPSAPILYEKEQVGYAYRDDNVLPLQTVGDILPQKAEGMVEIPLTASGEMIGEIKVEPPAEGKWTEEESALTNAVAQQVSTQIQSLRLLAATERARAEAQAATRQFTHESWEAFLDGIRNSERIGYAYDQAAVAPFIDPAPKDHDIQESIDVLDEHVGSLFLKAAAERPLTEADRAMVSAVARQIAQQVESLRLLADASRARAIAEQATSRLTRQSWQSFTSQHEQAELGYKYDSVQVTPMQADAYPQDISYVQPLSIRGETIGQIAVSGWKNVTPEAVELAKDIANRVSAHLENLRLIELNEKRARELGTVAAVSATASTVLDPTELLQGVVDLAKERFSLYHAHIYLADAAWNTLLLAAGAGEIGHQMVTTGHAVPYDIEKSIVARAAREKRPVLVNDVNSSEGYLPNFLLPDTRSELAIPMVVGEKLIGVFDVQSDQINHFSEEDANTYSTLATQVAIALQNARLYAEQAATVAQLRELDRLKSSFLANMSHELRTPLNSILGFADVMLEELDGPLTDNMRNDLGLIYKNGQHLLHLINDVLDMAKIESGKMNLNLEKFNLQEIIEEVTSITSPMASEKNLALFIDPDSDHEVDITADKIRIRQVLINLINNAIKFTEKGKIAIHVTREGKSVLISVKDTGLGIPHDHLESVFQEFTQVDTTTTRKVGGTGLGLPISRRLIEMHGGRLWAESTGVEGEGSTFYVFLPIEAKIKEDKEKVK